jgi:hypothetical protein
VLTLGLPFIDSLTQAAGGKVRVLAWAEHGLAPEVGYAVALLESFAFCADGAWTFIDWAQIDRGSWNGAQKTLNVVVADGRKYQFAFAAPGQLPEVFVERVNASIVFAHNLEIDGHRAVISKRRSLAKGAGQGEWRVTAAVGLDPSDPSLLAELERLRAEFE